MWAVGAVLVILTVVAYGFGLASAIASIDLWPPDAPPVDRVERLGPFAFPQSIVAAVQNGQLLALALAAYLASAVTAAEFGYGTIRTSLLARHDRVDFIVARLILVGVLGLAAILLTAALGALLPAAAALVGADLPAVAPVTVEGVAGLLGASWVTLLVVVVIATLTAVAMRNAAAGLLAVGLTFGIESGIANAGTILGGPWSAVGELLPIGSATSLAQAAIGAATDSPLATPPSVEAVLALPVVAAAAVAWIIGLGALSAFVLVRADIDA